MADDMTEKQREMTRIKDELMGNDEELKEEIQLSSPQGEIIMTKNIKEIIKKINEGYMTDTSEDYIVLEDIGINVIEINRKREVEKIKKLFELNESKSLLYLKDGIDSWTESVKNYWYNVNGYYSDELIIEKSEDIRAKLLKKIKEGLTVVPHTESKDFKSYQMTLERLLPEIKRTGYDMTNFDKLLDDFIAKVVFPALYEKNSSIEGRDSVFKNINLAEKATRAIHPLINPFLEEIEKLEVAGINDLPDWLAEQGVMAGYSADYLLIYDNYKKFFNDLKLEKEKYDIFIAEKDIKRAPKIILKSDYLENIEIIYGKIHRVDK